MSALEYLVEDVNLPALKSNFELFKDDLISRVSVYEIKVTEDNIQEAKNMMAELNKIKADIKDKEKKALEKFREKVDPFKEQIKTLVGICDSSRKNISDQVDKFEDETKAECERLLIKLIGDLRGDYKIETRFYSAQYQDCIKLTALTGKGGLTKAIKETILARVQKEQYTQNLYKGRYKEVEAECLKLGIPPFTEASVSHILLLDESEFQERLHTNIESEMLRIKDIQKKADEKAEREAEKKVKEKEVQDKLIAAAKEQGHKVVVDFEGKTNPEPDRHIDAKENNGRWRSFGNHMQEKQARTELLQKIVEAKEIAKEIIIRPSSLPRVLKCANSRHAPKVEIQEYFSGNNEGNALDEFVRRWFSAIGDVDLKVIIGEVEDKYKVDVAWLCWNMVKLLMKYKPSLINAIPQMKLNCDLPFGKIAGTSDLVGFLDKARAIIFDVKAGFAGKDYAAQLKGYMLALFKMYPDLEKIAIVTLYASSMKEKKEVFSREDAAKYEAELTEVYTGKKNGYCVGEQCEYCPLRYECEAKSSVLNSTISDLVERPTELLDIELHDKVNLIEKAVKRYKDLFKAKVKAEGEVRIGVDTYYINYGKKEEIKVSPESVGYLKQKVGDKYLRAVSISEEKLREVVIENVENGLKTAEWRAFFEFLSQHGYTETVDTERLAKK